MGFTSIWHWIVVLAVVLILFARPGKISGIMGDFGKGLKSFKDGMKGDKEKESISDDSTDFIEGKTAENKSSSKKKTTKTKSKAKTKASKKRASKTKSKA